MLARVVTDDRSNPNSRSSGTLNLSAVIAVLFISVAIYMVARYRRGVLPTGICAVWLFVWTGIALNTSGASGETLREGVREASVLAIGVLIYNAREAIGVPTATRLVQLVGFFPAVLALYQLATHTGLYVAHNVRANGTFAHPNSAAMFFAIATTISLWRYMDDGRNRLDCLLSALFAAALVATFSIDGMITLAAMLIVLGALHPGLTRIRLIPWGAAILVVVVFIATPLGSKRVAGESATNLSAAERGETTSTLDTRLYRWRTLLPQWEESPVWGRGLGTTTTSTNTRANRLNSLLPHNEYIRYLVETGVLGVLILIAGLSTLIRTLLRGRRLDGLPGARGFNASSLAIAVIIGCLVNSLADNTLLNSPTGYALAIVLGAVLSSGGEPRRQRLPETANDPFLGGEIARAPA
ncbi:MAG TPA: O-antigen ligase family protein [Solirubrobacteraceae bacterium]|nr:O-antigen ligase family protein [Solirubrobacteraceae bacterium]